MLLEKIYLNILYSLLSKKSWSKLKFFDGSYIRSELRGDNYSSVNFFLQLEIDYVSSYSTTTDISLLAWLI